MKKRAIIGLICLVLTSFAMMTALSSCSVKTELTEDMHDRFVYLIEESEELNNIFFGVGLPVYERGSLISDRHEIYFGYSRSEFDKVMENSKYYSADDIKAKAEQIYSSRYLSSVYETAFDGVLYDGGSYIRFYSEGDKLYQNTSINEYQIEKRIFDYSTMKIVDESDGEISVEISTFTDANRDMIRNITVSFKNENGVWYLNSPTY